MALLLLLTFGDEQEALDLAEQYENKGLVGIYKKPTMFCEFENRACSKRPQGFTRGLKYGWWVRAAASLESCRGQMLLVDGKSLVCQTLLT